LSLLPHTSFVFALELWRTTLEEINKGMIQL
jgi:hypothetical protein